MRIAVVPSAPALLPANRGQVDPVAEVRAAALAAVAWLGPSVRLVAADPLGRRVGESLLTAAGASSGEAAPSGEAAAPGEAVSSGAAASAVLVVADGSARRTEKAPGYLDERAVGFDASIDRALRQGDPAALAVLDEGLGAELLAAGVPAFRALGALVGDRRVRAQVDYADDPFGVQYWVVRWEV